MLTTSFPKFKNDSHAPWILSISQALVKKGWEVEVLTPSASDLEPNDNFDGVVVKRFRYMFSSLECVAYGANIPANVASSWRAKISFPFFCVGFLVAAFLRHRNCDLVHAQFGYSGLFYAIANKFRRTPKPLIVSFYGRDIAHANKYSYLYKILFNAAEKILVLSEDMRTQILSVGCPENKILVHHLGVNCNTFMYSERQISNAVTNYLVVANFVPKKGIPLALEAFAKLYETNKNIHLTLVGRGPQETNLRRQSERLGISKCLTITNNYREIDPRGCVLQSMYDADVILLPGVTTDDDYGGTPIVLMEAGATGLCAIATRNAGNAEVVIDHQTGLIVEENDIDELFTAMRLLFNANVLRKRLAKRASRHIRSEFNEVKQVNKLVQIYKDSLKQKNKQI
jgi:colanic acid/amylovoran biosynthesis glycosyltransferase